MRKSYSYPKNSKEKYLKVYIYRRNGFECRAVEADYDNVGKIESKKEMRKRKMEEYELEEFLGFKELTVAPI